MNTANTLEHHTKTMRDENSSRDPEETPSKAPPHDGVLFAELKDQYTISLAVCIMAIIIIMGCTGNIMAITAVKMSKKLRTVSNMFIVNLSICDLLFVGFVLPFNIYTYIADGWYLDESLCKFVGILGYSLTGTTIITITLIAWNRYKMVTNLAAYKKIFIPWNIGFMLAIAWAFPLVCLLPAITEVWGKFGYVPVMVTCNLILGHQSQSFKLFLLIFRAVIPSILIIYFYATIYRTTKASHRRVSRPTIQSSALNNHNQRREMHLTRMMIMIFVVFALSYFPCTLSSMIDWNTVLSKQFHMFCSITVYVGSAINPLIYGLMNSQFRNAYITIMTCQKVFVAEAAAATKSHAVTREAHLYEINQLLCDKKLTISSALLPDTDTSSPNLSQRELEHAIILPPDIDNE